MSHRKVAEILSSPNTAAALPNYWWKFDVPSNYEYNEAGADAIPNLGLNSHALQVRNPTSNVTSNIEPVTGFTGFTHAFKTIYAASDYPPSLGVAGGYKLGNDAFYQDGNPFTVQFYYKSEGTIGSTGIFESTRSPGSAENQSWIHVFNGGLIRAGYLQADTYETVEKIIFPGDTISPRRVTVCFTGDTDFTKSIKIYIDGAEELSGSTSSSVTPPVETFPYNVADRHDHFALKHRGAQSYLIGKAQSAVTNLSMELAEIKIWNHLIPEDQR